MSIIALMILAQMRALLADMVSGMWFLGFLEDPQQPDGVSSAGHGSNAFPLYALATVVGFVIVGGCLYWALRRRSKA